MDAETERPIEGALISASWAFERGLGLLGPAGLVERQLSTDSDGRYRVESLKDLPRGASMRVSRFTLVVYKRGYVAWRSDGIFPSGARRRDFSQRRNVARLEKWVPDYTHAQHLVFMGGGRTIQRAAAWEREPASLEMEGRPTDGAGRRPQVARAGVGPTALLDASKLLTADEIRGVTGYAGAFKPARLKDLPQTEFYDSVHFAAEGKTESFDVALRLWRLGEVAAEQQYKQVVSELPAPEARDEIGDTSVRVSTEAARALVFLLRDRGLIGSITCGREQCPEAAMVVRLGKLVESRMDQIPDSPGPKADATFEEAPTPETADPFDEPGPDAEPKPSGPDKPAGPDKPDGPDEKEQP